MMFCFKSHSHFEAESIEAALMALSRHFEALANAGLDSGAASMIAMSPDSQMSLLKVDPADLSQEVMH